MPGSLQCLMGVRQSLVWGSGQAGDKTGLSCRLFLCHIYTRVSWEALDKQI